MKLLTALCLIFYCLTAGAQVFLSPDGPGNTYDLITSVLAPGYNPIEVPDCSHSGFGDHIDEVFDNEIGANVFRFFIHTTPDNDRCINFDRQRNEIKTYDKSPDNLKGTIAETVAYGWSFKLDAGFQSSPNFTHIHQLKAVGGSESSMPLITLTTRLGSPDRLELRHAPNLTQTTIHQVDLAPFKGTWVNVLETVTYGEAGDASYSIEINRISDNMNLLSYSSNTLRMWKTGADFVRPKWGIYRSLINSQDLRDEEVLYGGFSIEELTILPIELLSFEANKNEEQIFLNWETSSAQNFSHFSIEKIINQNWESIGRVEGAESTLEKQSYAFTDRSPSIGSNHYRLKQIDLDAKEEYSKTVVVNFDNRKTETALIYPNPSGNYIIVDEVESDLNEIEIYDNYGRDLTNQTKGHRISKHKISIDLSGLTPGVYYLKMKNAVHTFYKL